MPSNLAAMKARPGSLTASAKVCPLDRERPQAEHILAEEARQRPAPVLDRELRPVHLCMRACKHLFLQCERYHIMLVPTPQPLEAS